MTRIDRDCVLDAVESIVRCIDEMGPGDGTGYVGRMMFELGIIRGVVMDAHELAEELQNATLRHIVAQCKGEGYP